MKKKMNKKKMNDAEIVGEEFYSFIVECRNKGFDDDYACYIALALCRKALINILGEAKFLETLDLIRQQDRD